ncbi:MAG: hypothetical protein ACTTH7_07760 [Treponema sp.]
MDPTTDFQKILEQHIAVKREEFDKTLLPQMQQNYSALNSVVKIFRSNLLKKGLVYDDPYKYDSRMTEIKVPSSETFADSERATVIGSRLAQYQTMLDFLTNSYQFKYSYLTPHRISAMIALNKTFQWAALADNSSHPNTRALGEICKSLQSVSDSLTGGLLRDSLGHISKLDKEIEQTLKQLTRIHREEYKLQVRKNLPSDLKVTPDDINNPIKVLKTIKKAFAAKEEKIPFYHELIFEVLKEDYGPNSAQLREEILKQLNAAAQKNTKTGKPENMRPMLLTGLRVIGSAGNHLEVCLRKILYNQEVLNRSRATIFTKLAAAFRKAFNIAEKKQEVSIMIKDTITNIQKKETLYLEDFEHELIQKIRLLKNLALGNSAVQQKLAGMSNEQLSDLLTRYIAACNTYLKSLQGLDEYYKTIDLILRSKMKGIKIELTTIHNAVIKANQCRAEYNANAEEIAQMKHLGITNE